MDLKNFIRNIDDFPKPGIDFKDVTTDENNEVRIYLNKIIEAIKREGNLHIDSICDYTGIEIKYVNSIINELVLNELVVEMNNKRYSLNV